MLLEYYVFFLCCDKEGWNCVVLFVIFFGECWKLEFKKDNCLCEKVKIKVYFYCFKWVFVDNGQFGEIVFVVDNDKEGELLGWEMLEYFGVVDYFNIMCFLFFELSLKVIKVVFEKCVVGLIWFFCYLVGLVC